MMADLDAVIARAKAAGVTGFMLAGVSPDGWETELAIAKRHPECAVSFGIHPQLVSEVNDDDLHAMVDALSARLRGATSPAAVGEIGLDRATPQRKQRAGTGEWLFREQLALAREANLPVILHVLSAHGRAVEILKQDGLPKTGGVMHSYSGPAELVPVYESLGLHIAFTGIVCQPRASKPRAAVQRVTLDRLLVETDAPFQTPEPHRPAHNEPAFLPTVVAEVARLRGMDAERVATQTNENARRLFRIA